MVMFCQSEFEDFELPEFQDALHIPKFGALCAIVEVRTGLPSANLHGHKPLQIKVVMLNMLLQLWHGTKIDSFVPKTEQICVRRCVPVTNTSMFECD